MSQELETMSADAAVPEQLPPHGAAHAHASCLNCGALLQGRYCHMCGQGADDHHRSIWHLAYEVLEGLTHLDGKLAHTLPALLIHPGRLARDHMEGRRRRHVAPFRLFLISLLLFMLAAEAGINRAPVIIEEPGKPATRTTTGALTRAQLEQAFAGDKDLQPGGFESWMQSHALRASQNRDYFLMLVFQWAHRLAVLMLPLLAGLLALFYVFRPEFYVYDHLVVAMQYLSFCFLLWAAMFFLPQPAAQLLMLPVLLWTPFNLYLILRTAYGSSRLWAAVKAMTLWMCTGTLFALLLMGLLLYALNEV